MQLLPAVAMAQYGGGGIVGGPFSIGYVNTSPTPAVSNATSGVPTTGSSGGGKVLGASAYNFTSNLYRGVRNTDVTQLQTILIADGYLHIVTPTGWFGPMTFAAVKEYQEANSIPETGYVGTLTRAALNQGTLPVSTNNEKQDVVSKIVGTVQSLWGDWESTRTQ